MTTNAYIFMWSCYGIDSIVPITQYEDQDKINTWAILKGEQVKENPLKSILTAMTCRARFNPQRTYEIYAMDCEAGITEENLWDWWKNTPQFAAELVRERGIKILSHRSPDVPEKKIKIT